MSEKELEKKLRQAVQQAGGQCYKFVSPGNSGVPDRIVVLPGGKIGFVELKQKGKKPTPQQRKKIDQLVCLGCIAGYIDGASQIDWVLDCIRNGG